MFGVGRGWKDGAIGESVLDFSLLGTYDDAFGDRIGVGGAKLIALGLDGSSIVLRLLV